MKRLRRKCRCDNPTYSETEWGTKPGSGMIDTWCVAHEPPLYAGAVPLDDWPWPDTVIAVLASDDGPDDD